MGWLDDVLVFDPLSPETVRTIVSDTVRSAVRGLAEDGWDVTVDDAAIDPMLPVLRRSRGRLRLTRRAGSLELVSEED